MFTPQRARVEKHERFIEAVRAPPRVGPVDGRDVGQGRPVLLDGERCGSGAEPEGVFGERVTDGDDVVGRADRCSFEPRDRPGEVTPPPGERQRSDPALDVLEPQDVPGPWRQQSDDEQRQQRHL